MKSSLLSPRHFFVDEAGDGTLYSRHGKCIVGEPGCSRFFVIGAIEVVEPQRLARELEDLRASLLADPWFKKVPSMQPTARKTALLFHAKDDVPEVRREVYRLLQKHDIKFNAAVRNKIFVEQVVKARNSKDPNYRYNPNELYDWTVSRVFADLLDNDQMYSVVFASRGNSDRTNALTEALKRAPLKAETSLNRGQSPPALQIQAVASRLRTELQAADYLLWSLQRFYENAEERYMELMWPHYRSVCYMHAKPDSGNSRSIIYTQKEPLTLAALKGLPNLKPEI